MIIKREFVSFDKLMRTDSRSKEIIDIAMEKWDDDYKEIFDKELKFCCLYQREMGWCMPEIGYILDSFKKLDKAYPFDNQFTLEDVNDVEIVNRDVGCVVLHLLNKSYGVTNIVKVVKIKP